MTAWYLLLSSAWGLSLSWLSCLLETSPCRVFGSLSCWEDTTAIREHCKALSSPQVLQGQAASAAPGISGSLAVSESALSQNPGQLQCSLGSEKWSKELLTDIAEVSVLSADWTPVGNLSGSCQPERTQGCPPEPE